jgi:hypothetical protein
VISTLYVKWGVVWCVRVVVRRLCGLGGWGIGGVRLDSKGDRRGIGGRNRDP